MGTGFVTPFRPEVAAITFGLLLVLLVLRVPIFLSLMASAGVGLLILRPISDLLGMLAEVPYWTISNFLLLPIPLFMVLSSLIESGGFGEGLYRSLSKWLRFLPGGLAIATTVGGAVMAACIGSSVATVAVFGRLAVGEMRKLGYHKSLALGSVAAAGCLGVMIPPSIPLIVYSFLTEQSIVQLFTAGILPGIMQALIVMIIVMIRVVLNPKIAPKGPPSTLKEKVTSLKGVWAMLVIVASVMVSIYGGIATVTESAAIGTVAALLLLLCQRGKSLGSRFREIRNGGESAVSVAVMILAIVMTAELFSRTINLTGVAARLADVTLSLPVPPQMIMLALLVVYLFLGMFLEGLSIMILTLSVVFPLSTALGYSPIWLGIFMTLAGEIGLLTPPVGLNVFVLQGMVPDVTQQEIFKSCIPYVIGYTFSGVLMIYFPQIVMFLPEKIL